MEKQRDKAARREQRKLQRQSGIPEPEGEAESREEEETGAGASGE